MNSSINSFSEPSNADAFNQAQTSEQTATSSAAQFPDAHQTTLSQLPVARQQPIPPPSESMQYRAIGLVRGKYVASAEQFTQGNLVTSDGEIDAVLLGRIVSLVRNHLDLTQEHLWVVYPRTRQQDGNLHIQIVGVWEPEKLAKQDSIELQTQQLDPNTSGNESPNTAATGDGYFSVRGEIVYQSVADKKFVVKIKQAPRKEADKLKYFKLQIEGDLATKAVGQFWDLQVTRQGSTLALKAGSAIAVLPSKPRPKKGRPQKAGYSPSPKRSFDTPRPYRKPTESSSTAPPRPVRKEPTPKPIKRQKPPQ